jgi:hypothetical protein
MKRFRFNIASLLSVIMVFGVGFAALREASDIWESGVFTLALAALLISILFAIHRTGKRRAFWTGFALLGSAYLGLSLLPSTESRLITTKALAFLDSKVPGRATLYTVINGGIGSGTGRIRVCNVTFPLNKIEVATGVQGQEWTLAPTTGKLLGGWSGTTENFLKIGHSPFALLAGWLGGQFSRHLCRASRSSEPSTAVDARGTGS